MFSSLLSFLGIQEHHLVSAFTDRFSSLWAVVRIPAVGTIFAEPVATAPVWARYFRALHFSVSQAKVSLGLLAFAFSPFPFSPTLRLLSNAFFENLRRSVPNSVWPGWTFWVTPHVIPPLPTAITGSLFGPRLVVPLENR